MAKRTAIRDIILGDNPAADNSPRRQPPTENTPYNSYPDSES